MINEAAFQQEPTVRMRIGILPLSKASQHLATIATLLSAGAGKAGGGGAA
jgi:hypothetical protein